MDFHRRRVDWAAVAAVPVFGWLVIPTTIHAERIGLSDPWLVMLAVPVGLLLAFRWPIASGVALAIGATWIRLVYLGVPDGSDQLIVSQAASQLAFSGGNPYGVGYDASWPRDGSPFVYGPLELLAAPPGRIVEALAAGGTLVILAFMRSFLTLAAIGSHYLFVQFGMSGINDNLPAFLILAGLVTMRRHRVAGALLLVLAAGVKPYAFAWFPAAIGFAGIPVALALIAGSAIIWSPLLLGWGIPSFIRSIELAALTHPFPENTLNMPQWRIIAVPLALASLLVRQWWVMVVAGLAIFCAVLFLDRWASYGYWLVVLPLVGMIGERAARFGLQAAVRMVRERSTTVMAPVS